MDKRGVELSMNIIIISIILILVLVVLAAFFITGFGGLAERIGRVAPDNLETATQNCQSKCLLAQALSGDVVIKNSGYCRTTIKIDSDGDSIADQVHHCWSSTIGINCEGVKEICEDEYPEASEPLTKETI